MIKKAINTLMDKGDLEYQIAKQVMNEIMDGEATDAQIATFLTALRLKGETIEEIIGCAEAMREHALKLPHNTEVLDIVGTGGDEAFTFNISTVSAFIIAAAGVPVAKHGNRSVSSKCGAADLLEALGARLDISAEASARVLEKTGICFMFAPLYHTSMKYAAPVRKEMGIRTIFNILGPLSSPAEASLQLLGVYDEGLVEPLAKVLIKLGVKRAMVVYGNDRLDEISLSAKTTVCEIANGEFKNYVLDPKEFGFEICNLQDVTGGDAKENARIAKDILNGEKGPKRDIVLLNTGACLYISGKAANIAEGVRMAADLIDSGKAHNKMKEFIKATNEVA